MRTVNRVPPNRTIEAGSAAGFAGERGAALDDDGTAHIHNSSQARGTLLPAATPGLPSSIMCRQGAARVVEL